MVRGEILEFLLFNFKLLHTAESSLQIIGKAGMLNCMDVEIKFCKSAFRHGFTEADIRLAIDNAIYDGYLENEELCPI